jgi:hypothetical protein
MTVWRAKGSCTELGVKLSAVGDYKPRLAVYDTFWKLFRDVFTYRLAFNCQFSSFQFAGGWVHSQYAQPVMAGAADAARHPQTRN